MNNPRPLIQIRSRKLGVLIYDSRQAARRTIDECAAAMGVSPEVYKTYETGSASPSLPQVELLSIYLNVPMEHFWSRQAISTPPVVQSTEEKTRMLALRNRVIGASLRLAREGKNLSIEDLAAICGLPANIIQGYENGETAIPLPELEAIAGAVDTPVPSLYDQHGPIGKLRSQQGTAQKLLDLTPELQAFVSQPVNQPYLEVALRLSQLPVEKLRALAENLLEITF